MTGLLSKLLSLAFRLSEAAGRARGLTCGFCLWAGAGSNRRPSTFQADARTN
jgi:hypothetical protein